MLRTWNKQVAENYGICVKPDRCDECHARSRITCNWVRSNSSFAASRARKSALPFILIELALIALLVRVPEPATVLPALMDQPSA